MRGNRVAEGSDDVIVQCRSPDVQKTQRHTDTYICIEGVKKKKTLDQAPLRGPALNRHIAGPRGGDSGPVIRRQKYVTICHFLLERKRS